MVAVGPPGPGGADTGPAQRLGGPRGVLRACAGLEGWEVVPAAEGPAVAVAGRTGACFWAGRGLRGRGGEAEGLYNAKCEVEEQ